jgi:hypothetical protein
MASQLEISKLHNQQTLYKYLGITFGVLAAISPAWAFGLIVTKLEFGILFLPPIFGTLAAVFRSRAVKAREKAYSLRVISAFQGDMQNQLTFFGRKLNEFRIKSIVCGSASVVFMALTAAYNLVPDGSIVLDSLDSLAVGVQFATPFLLFLGLSVLGVIAIGYLLSSRSMSRIIGTLNRHESAQA